MKMTLKELIRRTKRRDHTWGENTKISVYITSIGKDKKRHTVILNPDSCRVMDQLNIMSVENCNVSNTRYIKLGDKDHLLIVVVDLDKRYDDVEPYNFILEPWKAVAFDFDGVIHKYSEGWKDGSIYDEPNKDMLDLMLTLQRMKIPCVIISTREPDQIKEWWDKQDFPITAKPLPFETKFFNDCTYVGITNRKIPAQLYIDDRAYKYTGQTVKEFFTDLSKMKEMK